MGIWMNRMCMISVGHFSITSYKEKPVEFCSTIDMSGLEVLTPMVTITKYKFQGSLLEE